MIAQQIKRSFGLGQKLDLRPVLLHESARDDVSTVYLGSEILHALTEVDCYVPVRHFVMLSELDRKGGK